MIRSASTCWGQVTKIGVPFLRKVAAQSCAPSSEATHNPLLWRKSFHLLPFLGKEVFHFGKPAEAESLYKLSLEILENTLGSDHPNVALSLHNRSGLYMAEGKYAEAEALYKQSLAVWEKALGPDHPNIATSLNNLVELYKRMGKKRRSLNLGGSCKKDSIAVTGSLGRRVMVGVKLASLLASLYCSKVLHNA